MAAVEDAKALQKRAYALADEGRQVELKALLEEHPGLDVDEYRGERGRTLSGRSTLYCACYKKHTECVRLLIDHKANVNAKNINDDSALHGAATMGNMGCAKLLVQHGADVDCQNNEGSTPLMYCAYRASLDVAQYLLEQKADVHYRISREGFRKNQDALWFVMRKSATGYKPGIAFAFLSCNTDAKNLNIGDCGTTAAIRDAHMETYSHVQAYIDEYHRILNLVLSEHVPVDPRFGLGQMGIYQEPLERTLEYLGLSMSKDQVVNTSIDGEAVRRALIPGHLLNANHWFGKYKSR
jgi:hypothetical protein